MAEMRLIVAGAGGRMGRTLVKAIAESKDFKLAGALEDARSPLLGYVDDMAVGYIEVYDPARDVLGAHAPILPGDIGAHVLIGDEEHLGRYSVAIGRAEPIEQVPIGPGFP